MGDAAGKVSLARSDDIMVAGIDDAGGKDHVADIDLMLDGPGQFGVGLDQWPVVGGDDLGGIVLVQQ